MLSRVPDKLEGLARRLRVALWDGDELEGYPAFRGYRSGSSLSKGRAALIGGYALAVLFQSAGAIAVFAFENGELPAAVEGVLSLLRDAGCARVLFPLSTGLAVVTGCLLISQWKRHGRVVRALSNLNYNCTNLLNRNALIGVSEAMDVFCAEANEVFSREMPRAGIGCAIRYRTPNGLETVARKGELNPRRGESTVPLDPKGRLLSMLDDSRYSNYSAFVCNDTKGARDKGGLDPDENGRDPELGGDDASMVASRLISYDRREEKIIGVFYITSKKANAFHANVIDLYLFLHDYANLMMLNVLDRKAAHDQLNKGGGD